MSAIEKYKSSIRTAEDALAEASECFTEAVQEIVDKHGFHLATGHMSDTWQVKRPRSKYWKHAFDYPPGGEPEIFDELQKLEDLGEDCGIGPSNMEMFKPRRGNSK